MVEYSNLSSLSLASSVTLHGILYRRGIILLICWSAGGVEVFWLLVQICHF